ncbi:hypothetical protein GF345_05350, partial [Candidatus Woesearchaeota archaeon]|nr:hypothetical protein [Candidatus Woesearchaeota archaeon]
DMRRTGAVPIDMVVCNLYPFEQTVAKEGVTFEKARSNIDIGGPTMLRASAKNCLRTLPVVDPEDYKMIATHLMSHHGCSTFAFRAELAGKAFAHTADYDKAIAAYMDNLKPEDMKCYPTVHERGGE